MKNGPQMFMIAAVACVSAMAAFGVIPSRLSYQPLAPPPPAAQINEPIEAIPLAADADALALTRGRVLSGVSSVARRAVNIDGFIHAWAIGSLDLTKPLPHGATLPVPATIKNPKAAEASWTAILAGDNGSFRQGLASGALVWIEVSSAAERVMMLEATGHSMVYVNGQPRMGDPYSTGAVKLPVLMKQGTNILAFAAAGRGEMRATLVKPLSTSPYIAAEDRTIPDLIACSPGETAANVVVSQLGVVVVNPTNHAMRLAVVSGNSPSPREMTSRFIDLPPLAATKLNVPFESVVKPGDAAFDVRMKLILRDGPAQPIPATAMQTLKVLPVAATRRVAFTSDIDGSTQYYSVVPPKGYTGDNSAPPALVLSLHGASVEAPSQAGSYAAKDGIVIACPTNRRPFGFDWEDWGRVDGLEVLEHARTQFATDRLRQYVTGHSMGGHGAWQFGVLFPDQFAVVAPSAGWLSFETYGNKGMPTEYPGATEKTLPIENALRAAAASCDTPAQLHLLTGRRVAILHGDADDNVPVSEARAGRDLLLGLGFSEEAKESQPPTPPTLVYHEQKGAGHWWGGATSGSECLDWPPFFEMFATSRLNQPAGTAISLSPAAAGDARASRPLLDQRGFAKGSFKRVFDRGFVLVYGTKGTPQENDWSIAKARFDAEQWWVMGNGSTSVMSDASFADRQAELAACNVIFYGNADTNSAWRLAKFNISRGSLAGFGDEITGDDIGFLLAVQSPDSQGCVYGFIGGTGIAGMHAIERAPIFRSGAGVPEVLIFRASTWTEGLPGVERAGTLEGSTHPRAKPGE